jgi:hypothetical protein
MSLPDCVLMLVDGAVSVVAGVVLAKLPDDVRGIEGFTLMGPIFTGAAIGLAVAPVVAAVMAAARASRGLLISWQWFAWSAFTGMVGSMVCCCVLCPIVTFALVVVPEWAVAICVLPAIVAAATTLKAHAILQYLAARTRVD